MQVKADNQAEHVTIEDIMLILSIHVHSKAAFARPGSRAGHK